MAPLGTASFLCVKNEFFTGKITEMLQNVNKVFHFITKYGIMVRVYGKELM